MATPPNLLPLPHAPRSAIFNALFELLKFLPPPAGMNWNTQSQYLQLWDQIPEAAQPALFLYRGAQTFEQKHVNGVTKLHFRVSLWIYFRTDGLKTRNTYPDQITDQIIDNLEQLFQTMPPAYRLTLGDTCWHCWIDGNVMTDPGIIDSQALIIVPISILV